MIRATPPGERAPRSDPGDAPGSERAGRTADAQLRALGALLLEQAEEASGYLRLLASARADRARLRLRESAQRAGRRAALLLARAALLTSAVVLIALGLAGALSELLGGRAWLGALAAGGLLLTALGAGALLARRRWLRRELERTEAKYDELEHEHRARFGRHASDPAPAQRGAAAAAPGAAGARGAAPLRDDGER